ncbi:MAG TPA: DUF559 domain-containing protein [Longimicrobiales bacterium]|nr:DUF559 domain-containing protein [Longimicrobiales bacterium]
MSRSRKEEAISRLAARQHGVVTRGQLLGAGLSSHVVEHRLTTGQFVALHRGVYRVGPVVAPHAREMAATLACGVRAVLSHESAAGLWGMLPKSGPDVLEVAIPGGIRRRPGIRIHRLGALRPEEVSRLQRIPVTTAARTLYDLAGRARSGRSRRQLEKALAEALARGLTDRGALRKLLARHGGGAGSARMRALLDSGGPAFTRSEAEERFLELIRSAQLDEPEANAKVEGLEVDFIWPGKRLVVEVDGFAFHSSAAAFEGDRRRDARLAAAGLLVVRVTWRQLADEPMAVVARLAQAMARAGPR